MRAICLRHCYYENACVNLFIYKERSSPHRVFATNEMRVGATCRATCHSPPHSVGSLKAGRCPVGHKVLPVTHLAYIAAVDARYIFILAYIAPVDARDIFNIAYTAAVDARDILIIAYTAAVGARNVLILGYTRGGGHKECFDGACKLIITQ